MTENDFDRYMAVINELCARCDGCENVASKALAQAWLEENRLTAEDVKPWFDWEHGKERAVRLECGDMVSVSERTAGQLESIALSMDGLHRVGDVV